MAADGLARVHQVHADAEVEDRLPRQHEIEVAALLEGPELPLAGAEGPAFSAVSVLVFEAPAAGGEILLGRGDEDAVEVDGAVPLRVVEAEPGVLQGVRRLPFRRGGIAVIAEDVVGCRPVVLDQSEGRFLQLSPSSLTSSMRRRLRSSRVSCRSMRPPPLR